MIILVHECIIKNKIPVVLLEGTGGCCDLFAKCYHLYNEYHPKIISSDQVSSDDKTEQLKAKLREKLEITTNKLNIDSSDQTNYFELIYECIDQRNIFLNFIDIKVHSDTEPDVDLAILQALLNGNHKKLFK